MSDVIRLTDQMLKDLEVFNTLYIQELNKHKYESALCRTLLQEHLNYSLSNQVGFAIRYAANNLRQELTYSSNNLNDRSE